MDEEDSKKSLGYSLLYAVTYLLALLPFSVLYVFSDILYFIVYYIVRYRRKIVRKNLNNSFPEKSERQIVKIEKEFYHHLCDCYFEAVKLLSTNNFIYLRSLSISCLSTSVALQLFRQYNQ